MKIDEIAKQYFEVKEPLQSKQTFRTNLGFYNNHIFPVFSGSGIKTVHYVDYQKFANNLLAKDGKNLKPKTVKNILTVLVGIIDFSKKNEWYTGENYASMVELPKYDNKYYITINAELQKKYLKAIMQFHEPEYRDIFIFLLHGRRKEEVLNLKWEYLDLNEKIMYLPSSHNKSRKTQQFMLTDVLVDALKERHKYAITLQDTPFPRGHVFLNPKTLKRYNNITKPWNRLLKRSNLPHVKLHAIRHFTASYLINELQLPIQEVSVMLGHSDIKITQRYYNPKPSIAKNCTQSLFDDLQKTKGDKYVEELDAIIKVGESAKSTILSLKELKKVTL